MDKNLIIAKLSALWGKCLVGHHKSCDPNFYIETKYSFGVIDYYVTHAAYIGDDIEGHFHTLNAAQKFLIQKLKENIETECRNNLAGIENSEKPSSHWQNILAELKNLKIESDEKYDYAELYLNLLPEFHSYKDACDSAHKQLDLLKIPKCEESWPELCYSLEYRIELLKNLYKNMLEKDKNMNKQIEAIENLIAASKNENEF